MHLLFPLKSEFPIFLSACSGAKMLYENAEFSQGEADVPFLRQSKAFHCESQPYQRFHPAARF